MHLRHSSLVIHAGDRVVSAGKGNEQLLGRIFPPNVTFVEIPGDLFHIKAGVCLERELLALRNK